MSTTTGTVAVQYHRSRGLVRLVVGCEPTIITTELSPTTAREIAQALIDSAAIADGIEMPPLCRECDDGDQDEADGLGGE